ncbi:MAG: T9SS type A sorting domain-containing protein [Aureispira sp.]|nr:T9SS type A sorting domain-containing protein [Aureispira sp.]
MKHTYTYLKLSTLFLGIMLVVNNAYSQTLTTNPCAEPATAQWTIGGGCVATSTAGFTNLFDPTSCNSGVFDDGWAWYTGTGAQNTITYTPDPGFDATIHLFEVPDPSVCSVIELGCSDDAGAGGTEIIVGGGTLGTLYYIRIQLVGSNTTMTGCLEVVNNPATCTDGIHNGGETGVDCGGPCPTACQPPTTNSSTGCPGTANSILDPITCDEVGTAAFNSGSGLVNFIGGSFTAPPNPSCFTASGNGQAEGTWAMYDPQPGLAAAAFNIHPDDVIGADDINVAFYQGSCGSLTEIGCGELLTRSGSTFTLNPLNVTGIDDTQPLYVFMHSSRNFDVNNAHLIGFDAAAPNDDCATASVATDEGCNVGSTPASFTPPSAVLGAGACLGGIWSSNENTVFYSFTPTATDATLEIDDIACNEGGTTGQAQFGVWESCADVGTYGPEFVGCVVGTDPLVLAGLTVGNTYIIAVDGNAGDWCDWTFEATGGIVLLYVDLVSFEAKSVDKTVLLNWETETEKFITDFTVQRSVDGIEFEDIYAKVSKNGFTQFSTVDPNPLPGVSYYRLKIADVDGEKSYSDIVSVTREGFDQKDKLYIHNIYPQPTKGQLNLDLEVGEATSLNVKIVNTLGQVVLQETLSVTPKYYNKVALDLGDLGAGSYSLIIENKDTKEARLERIHIAR